MYCNYSNSGHPYAMLSQILGDQVLNLYGHLNIQKFIVSECFVGLFYRKSVTGLAYILPYYNLHLTHDTINFIASIVKILNLKDPLSFLIR